MTFLRMETLRIGKLDEDRVQFSNRFWWLGEVGAFVIPPPPPPPIASFFHIFSCGLWVPRELPGLKVAALLQGLGETWRSRMSLSGSNWSPPSTPKARPTGNRQVLKGLKPTGLSLKNSSWGVSLGSMSIRFNCALQSHPK